MEENTKVNKDYKEAFNQGYELSKELGLKPDVLKDLAAGNNRMQAMQDGMEQYANEITQEKEKDIIPPFDMDSIDDRTIHLDNEKLVQNKDKGRDLDL